MAKETTFEHPPKGHVALLAYDSANDRWQAVYVDASGNLQVDVVASGLPSGAATEATLADCKTALELIDDLRNALNSVATDELDIVIDGQNADVEVTQTTPADLVVAGHSYDGSAWRKNNLLWGYNDVFDETVQNLSASAGLNSLTTTAVPSGYIYVVVAASTVNITTACTRTRKVATGSGGGYCDFHTTPTPAAGVHETIDCWIPLKEGDYVTAYFYGCVAGDDIYLSIWGYKMKIDM